MTLPALLPPVSESGNDRVVILVEELIVRAQSGESVDVQAFLAEHPEHANRLRTLLPTLQVLAEFGQSRLPEPPLVKEHRMPDLFNHPPETLQPPRNF